MSATQLRGATGHSPPSCGFAEGLALLAPFLRGTAKEKEAVMTLPRKIHPLIAITLAGALALGTASVSAATFIVTRADDPAPDGCLADDCSLREAVDATATTPGEDTIVLGSGQYQTTLGEIAIDRVIAIRGAGSAATLVTSSGNYPTLHVVTFGALTLEGAEIASVGDSPVIVGDGGTATLRDIHVPATSGAIGTESPVGDTGTGSLRVEDSAIDSGIVCLQPDGSCRVFDSTTKQIAAIGELELVRVDVDGAHSDFYGVTIAGHHAATIEDSTIRRTRRPLYLLGDDETAATVHVRRTRFIDNTGPLIGDRASRIDMDEVEFRHHVVDDANAGNPAVLYAIPGPIWAISRALVVGNRGGDALDGAVIRVVGGGRVAFDNSTFDDNTFRAGASFGHTIGVYNSTNTLALLWLFHTTMRRADSLDDATVGSLLTVRGPMTDVRVANSALHGTCGFGGGGSILQGVGNAEAPGDSCGLDPATNIVDMPAMQMALGALDDHGGFTRTFYPAPRLSFLIDAADPAYCALFGSLDQRRYVRPPDGADCDIGAVEVEALSDTIFADAFEG
jgi:hypothetical protein